MTRLCEFTRAGKGLGHFATIHGIAHIFTLDSVLHMFFIWASLSGGVFPVSQGVHRQVQSGMCETAFSDGRIATSELQMSKAADTANGNDKA